MAIQGLIGTGSSDIGADERPLNWRQGILMRYPNGHAPITALTSAMKKKVTDDPEFNWWEREVSNVRLQMDQDPGVDTQIDVADDPYGFGGGEQVKTGDLLLIEETGEIVRATADGVAGYITVTRSWGDVAVEDFDHNGANINPNLVIIGSVYEEGADTPESVRYRASKFSNYTQIFRNSLKATRTAMQTRLRTVAEVQDAKTQALLYHSIAMEYAFIFGEKVENTGGSEPKRSTNGIINRIPSVNIVDKGAAGVGWDEMEDIFLAAFRFGSQEKMAFLGNRALLTIQRMIRQADAVNLEITPAVKEFGMDVRKLFTPYGSLILKTHPLFNQIQSGDSLVSGSFLSWDTWMLIVDMADLTYRPLRNSDTQYLPDRQANGIDGLTSEYLTECGLEVHHGKHHYLVQGLNAAAAEA